MLIDGRKLAEQREGKGKKQSQVAKVLGITQGAYSVREKTGNFADTEIDKICEFLDIKKEQIQMSDFGIDELTFLINKTIQNESALKVILSTQAEILAKLTDGNATRIRTDLESAVDSLSKLALERLQR